jgi:hypothetical protein
MVPILRFFPRQGVRFVPLLSCRCWAQRARCQAETPPIVLCRFPGSTLFGPMVLGPSGATAYATFHPTNKGSPGG